jgi:SAM-dependent methyltransferase
MSVMKSKYEELEPLFATFDRGPAVDIGCGYGESLKVLAGLGYNPLYGYDILPDCIEAARNRLEDSGSTFYVFAKDATTLEDVATNSVALICSRGALHYFVGNKVANTFKRVLRPGGHVVAELNGLNYYLWPKHLKRVPLPERFARLAVYVVVLLRTLFYELFGFQPRFTASAPEIGWTPRSIKRFADWAGLDVLRLDTAPTLRGYLVVMRKPL